MKLYMAAFANPKSTMSDEIRRWCYQTFGEPGHDVDTFYTRWEDNITNGEVIFSRESDLMMFLLRWQ